MIAIDHQRYQRGTQPRALSASQHVPCTTQPLIRVTTQGEPRCRSLNVCVTIVPTSFLTRAIALRVARCYSAYSGLVKSNDGFDARISRTQYLRLQRHRVSSYRAQRMGELHAWRSACRKKATTRLRSRVTLGVFFVPFDRFTEWTRAIEDLYSQFKLLPRTMVVSSNEKYQATKSDELARSEDVRR